MIVDLDSSSWGKKACFLPMLSSLWVRPSFFKELSEMDSSRMGVRDPRLSNIFSVSCPLLVPFQSAVLIDTKGRGAGGGKKSGASQRGFAPHFHVSRVSFFFSTCALVSCLSLLFPFCLWFHNFCTFIIVFFFLSFSPRLPPATLGLPLLLPAAPTLNSQGWARSLPITQLLNSRWVEAERLYKIL